MGIETVNYENGLRRTFETRPEIIQELRALFDGNRFGLNGVDDLENLLVTVPQRDNNGYLRYLLTAGMAVELIATGYKRQHHDIDLVILGPLNNRWEHIGTDNVTAANYWADMKFDPDYLVNTARYVFTRRNEGMIVGVVHPAILMVQKSSEAFGRPPRKKDIDDVLALIDYWHKGEPEPISWQPVIAKSLDALPFDQYDKTVDLLNQLLNRYKRQKK